MPDLKSSAPPFCHQNINDNHRIFHGSGRGQNAGCRVGHLRAMPDLKSSAPPFCHQNINDNHRIFHGSGRGQNGATGLCLRGSRVPWRSGRGFEDGVGLPVCGID